MPHLQFEINKKLKEKERLSFIDFTQRNFSKIMKTGIDHIAITIRELKKSELSLGRVENKKTVCFMNLDIRGGRTLKQQKTLVRTLMKGVNDIFKVDTKNQYATITSHKGNNFCFFEKNLNDWLPNDNPSKENSK